MMRIEPYHPADMNAVLKLYAAVWGQAAAAHAKNRWNWQFCNNPYNIGAAPHIFIAAEKENVVGLFAAIPATAICHRKKIICAWAVDLMVHPLYRRKGIFTMLNNAMLDYSRKKKIELFLVFPNRNSKPVMKKLGWRTLGQIPVLVRPLNTRAVMKKVLTSSLKLMRSSSTLSLNTLKSLLSPIAMEQSEQFQIEPVTQFPAAIDDFFADLLKINKLDFIVERTCTYLNWRYFDPDRTVKYRVLIIKKRSRLKGYMVLRVADIKNIRYGYIVDVLTVPERAVLNALIANAITFFSSKKVDMISCKLSFGPYLDMFRALGFIQATKPFGEELLYYPLGLAPPDRLESCFITRGDADTDFVISTI